MNTSLTELLRRKESQLIMELQCNATADIPKKQNYLKNQLLIKSTVILSAITISLIRISLNLWVYVLQSSLLLSTWFYRWSLSNVLTGSERILTLNNLKQLQTLFSLLNSSIQVYSCFWLMLIWLSINQNSLLDCWPKITMITFQCGTLMLDIKFFKQWSLTPLNHQSCSD